MDSRPYFNQLYQQQLPAPEAYQQYSPVPQAYQQHLPAPEALRDRNFTFTPSSVPPFLDPPSSGNVVLATQPPEISTLSESRPPSAIPSSQPHPPSAKAVGKRRRVERSQTPKTRTRVSNNKGPKEWSDEQKLLLVTIAQGLEPELRTFKSERKLEEAFTKDWYSETHVKRGGLKRYLDLLIHNRRKEWLRAPTEAGPSGTEDNTEFKQRLDVLIHDVIEPIEQERDSRETEQRRAARDRALNNRDRELMTQRASARHDDVGSEGDSISLSASPPPSTVLPLQLPPVLSATATPPVTPAGQAGSARGRGRQQRGSTRSTSRASDVGDSSWQDRLVSIIERMAEREAEREDCTNEIRADQRRQGEQLDAIAMMLQQMHEARR